MQYQRIYNQLVNNAKTRPVEGYTEKHHIIPKCMGGDDSESNIVKLTVREHFLAHWLLAKANPQSKQLQYAFFCMIRDPHGHRKLSSRQIKIAKETYRKAQSIRFSTNNPMHNPSAKLKHSERMKISNPAHTHPNSNPFKGKSYVKGKRWYNNGVINKYIDEKAESIPDGFVLGMKAYKRIRSTGRESNHG